MHDLSFNDAFNHVKSCSFYETPSLISRSNSNKLLLLHIVTTFHYLAVAVVELDYHKTCGFLLLRHNVDYVLRACFSQGSQNVDYVLRTLRKIGSQNVINIRQCQLVIRR